LASSIRPGSKRELCGGLRDAGSRRPGDISERGVVDVSAHGVRPEKLSMVEGIEQLEAYFQGLRLGELCGLVQRDIVVVHTWPKERLPRRIALSAERIGAEKRGIEIRLAVARVVVELKIASDNIR
jgi:hypothetical protein